MRTALFGSVLAGVLALASPALAQDSAVTSGIVAYQAGDPAEALRRLDAALADPGSLKAKNVARAYLFRARARIDAFSKASALSESPDPAALPSAMDDLLAARAADDARLASQIEEQIDRLAPLLVLAAAAATGDTAATAIPWLDKVERARPDDYRTTHIRAQLRLEAAGGYADASDAEISAIRADLQATLTRYASHPPPVPDPTIPTVHYQLAAIARLRDADIDAALRAIALGLEAAEAQEKALAKASVPEADAATLRARLLTITEQLRTFELDCYLHAPDRREEGIAKLEAATKRDPGNPILWAALASLLEPTDPDRAVASWEKAHELEPTGFATVFNLGALYTNRAAALLQQANALDDHAKAAALTKKANAEMEQAVAWLEKAHALDPTDLTVVKGLEQAYIQLERMEDFTRMKEVRKKLQGG